MNQSGNRGCNYSVGNIIIWGEDLDLSYTVIGDSIVFRTITGEQAIYHIAEYTTDFPYVIQQLTEDAGSLQKAYGLQI